MHHLVKKFIEENIDNIESEDWDQLLKNLVYSDYNEQVPNFVFLVFDVFNSANMEVLKPFINKHKELSNIERTLAKLSYLAMLTPSIYQVDYFKFVFTDSGNKVCVPDNKQFKAMMRLALILDFQVYQYDELTYENEKQYVVLPYHSTIREFVDYNKPQLSPHNFERIYNI